VSAAPVRGGTVAAMTTHAKQRMALRYWLQGAGYMQALKAMDFAEGFHQGTRKDGVTPEFAHQVQIVSYLRTLAPHLIHPEETLVTGFLHDVREDYDVDDAEVRNRFGALVADSVDAVTKTFRGVRRNDADLFDRMAGMPIASVFKPADRINNQNTMVGVFTTAKMQAYAQETTELFLPMIKKARRTFPEQEPAYENEKLMLVSQLDFVAAITASAT
jgi:(p)ppGpp synthase/HD superfamily hydrolase